MAEANTHSFEQELILTQKFDELVNTINDNIQGLDYEKAMPRIKMAIRGYFLTLGESIVNIKEKKPTGDEQQLEIIQNLPEPNETFNLTDVQVAITVQDNMAIVYYNIGEGWLQIAIAKPMTKEEKNRKTTNAVLASLLRKQDSMNDIIDLLKAGQVRSLQMHKLTEIFRQLPGLLQNEKSLLEIFNDTDYLRLLASYIEKGEVHHTLADCLYLTLELIIGTAQPAPEQQKVDQVLVPHLAKLQKIQTLATSEPLNSFEELLGFIAAEFKDTDLKLPNDMRVHAFEATQYQFSGVGGCNQSNSVTLRIGFKKCTIQIKDSQVIVFMDLYGNDVMLPVAY